MAKYPWGDAPGPMNVMMGIMLAFAILIGAFLAHVGPDGAVGDAYPSPADLNGVAVVTCAYIVVWYIFLGNQVSIRFNDGISGEVKDKAKKIADVAVANTMEQGIPFLVLLWAEAVFVNPLTAQRLGWIYVIFRYFYPIFFGWYGQFTAAVEASTQPNYIVIMYFLVTVFYKAKNGRDWHTEIHNTSPWLMLLLGIFCASLSMIHFLVLSKITTTVIINGVKKDLGGDDDEYEYEDE